jgi:hypothetical protein
MTREQINTEDQLCRQTIDAIEKTIALLACYMECMVKRRAELYAARKKLKQQEPS